MVIKYITRFQTAPTLLAYVETISRSRNMTTLEDEYQKLARDRPLTATSLAPPAAKSKQKAKDERDRCPHKAEGRDATKQYVAAKKTWTICQICSRRWMWVEADSKWIVYDRDDAKVTRTTSSGYSAASSASSVAPQVPTVSQMASSKAKATPKAKPSSVPAQELADEDMWEELIPTDSEEEDRGRNLKLIQKLHLPLLVLPPDGNGNAAGGSRF